MLLTYQGYFEEGKFITDTPVHIPDGRKTIVTVLDEEVNVDKERINYAAYWNKIIEDIQNSNEMPEGEPERICFISRNKIDAL